VSPTATATDALLTQLLTQTDGRVLDVVTMRALVEEASQSGAERALATLGLDDEQARRDMRRQAQCLASGDHLDRPRLPGGTAYRDCRAVGPDGDDPCCPVRLE
jgi:hypothetical protein